MIKMLCCVGLIGGFAVGAALGGPYQVALPAIGFFVGLAGDVKIVRKEKRTEVSK